MKKWFHLCIILSFLCFLYCCHGLPDYEHINNESYLQKNPVRVTSKTRSNTVVEYMGSHYRIINQPLSIEDARIYYSDSSLSTTHKALCALGPQSFQSVYNTLQSGVGIYYSSSELSTFIYPYSVFLL